MSDDTPVVQCTGVVKDYRSLRPLRLADLRVGEGERVLHLVLGSNPLRIEHVVTSAVFCYCSE